MTLSQRLCQGHPLCPGQGGDVAAGSDCPPCPLFAGSGQRSGVSQGSVLALSLCPLLGCPTLHGAILCSSKAGRRASAELIPGAIAAQSLMVV